MSKAFNPENHAKLSSDERKKLLPPDKILNMMNLKKRDVLLDVGAGKGYFAIPALELVGEKGLVIAADISGKMLDLLLNDSGKKSNLQTILCDRDNIAVKADSVDKVLMSVVLHEVDNAVEYLKMLKNLLKKSGHLFIIEWNPGADGMGPPEHERISKNNLEKFLIQAGYTIQHFEDINPYQYFCEAKVN
jgi:ubiquinone/menaquinone biosynthesis C-methylase UbiE